MPLPLKILRERKGITQAELSKLLNISPSTVGMWEQGRREPDYNNLKRLANIFDVSADYLIGNETPSAQITLSDEQEKLLNGFASLNPDGKSLIMNMIGQLNFSRSSEFQKIKMAR